MSKRTTLWQIDRHTQAKHMILRKYLDAWIPILGGTGKFAKTDLVMIDAFAGPGRYAGGEEGSPLLMLRAYREQPGRIRARPHFFFIEEVEARASHLRAEIDALALADSIDVEVICGSFNPEFPELIGRLRARFHGLPPTFAFIDPFGAGDLPVALSSPLLDLPRCEVLIYFPVAFLARFGDRAEFAETMRDVFGEARWMPAFAPSINFQDRKRMLLDLFMAELQKRLPLVRSFEITPAHEAGGNTYHLVFGTANEHGLRRMKDAMWQVDPSGGQGFRDSTLAEHPVLFTATPDLDELEQMLRQRFGSGWFTIEEAESFVLLETPFRDNGHLKTPTLRPAEKRGELEVRRGEGRPAGSFGPNTRMRFPS